MKHFWKLLSLAMVGFTAASYSAFSYSQQDKSAAIVAASPKVALAPKEPEDYQGLLQELMDKVKKDYVEEKSDKQLVEAAAQGILSSLDPHSSYMNENDFRELQVQTKGEFGGIGVEVTMEHSLLKVVAAIEGTPAAKANLKSGDYISKIDNQSIIGLPIDEIVKKLRGKPGSKVNITVLRRGEKAPLEINIIRQNIQIRAVRSMRHKDIAYIKINSFSEQAYAGTVRELNRLKEEIGKDKIKGLVLDLRDNPGGLLEQAVEISDLFLDKGMRIVTIKGRNKENDLSYEDENDQALVFDLPLVVLINEGSASASEIVAGALQDNKRAIILGAKSFGKGSVQSVIPLKKGGGALRMTTALYYTPSGRSIQASGIEPDIIVTEAKLEKASKNGLDSRSEAGLNNHLQAGKSDNSNKSASDDIDNLEQVNDENLELYNKDYQLARALDLIRGISLYHKKLN